MSNLAASTASVSARKKTGSRLTTLISVGVVGLLVAGSVFAVWSFSSAEMEGAIAKIKVEQRADARDHAHQTEQALKQIYQNIRTLSMLPDVRGMDRHATNLGDSAKATIQQVYNNLWSNVSVSEIYFIPESFDPQKVDTVTGKPEEPALMFDEMVTGNAADAEPAGAAAEKDGAPLEQPELEGEEYTLIAQQIAYYRSKFPDNASIKGLNVPIISGSTVVTCDNTDFNRTLVEYDRQGLVLSVPYFKPDGKFGGVVSAIVRLRVLEKYLPPADAALVNPGYKLAISATNPGQAKVSSDFVNEGVADPSLPYSEAITLDIPDPQGSWKFWSGISTASFESHPEIQKVRNQAKIGYAAIAISAVFILLLIYAFNRRILRPAQRITAALINISEGNIDEEVPLAGRKDMLGDISRAVITFKNKVMELREADSERMRKTAEQMQMQQEREAEKAQRARDVLLVMEHLGAGLERLADCNIRMTIDEPFTADFEPIRHDFNRSIGAFQTTLTEVLAGTTRVQSTSAEMAEAADDLAKRSEQQAAALEQTSAALEQISVNVSMSKDGANQTRELVKEARTCSAQSGLVVNEAISAMQLIRQSSSEIGSIISVIDQIAFQTNLLALNAGVEAARAGEAGRGFAVVAHEVRELSQRCSAAAQQIKDLIGKSSEQVQSGVKLVEATGDALKQIDTYVESIDQRITRIVSAISEQSIGLSEVTSGLHVIDDMTQRNTALSHNTAELSVALSGNANDLAAVVTRFKLNRRSASRSPEDGVWDPAHRGGSAPSGEHGMKRRA